MTFPQEELAIHFRAHWTVLPATAMIVLMSSCSGGDGSILGTWRIEGRQGVGGGRLMRTWIQDDFASRTVNRLALMVTGGTQGEVAFAKGTLPKTYGEAALFRTANQGNLKGGGGKFPLYGSYDKPVVRQPRPPTPEGNE